MFNFEPEAHDLFTGFSLLCKSCDPGLKGGQCLTRSSVEWNVPAMWKGNGAGNWVSFAFSLSGVTKQSPLHTHEHKATHPLPRLQLIVERPGTFFFFLNVCECVFVWVWGIIVVFCLSHQTHSIYCHSAGKAEYVWWGLMGEQGTYYTHC